MSLHLFTLEDRESHERYHLKGWCPEPTSPSATPVLHVRAKDVQELHRDVGFTLTSIMIDAAVAAIAGEDPPVALRLVDFDFFHDDSRHRDT